ncbi:hypothetical protein [Jeotgalicoccus meleagridis]|uniref:Uncharacterized protein n=1 Tax=Jeotgalicoccus meleagridis TaxID=2759181 RepID=A0A6V7RBQ9_9STAP|nr:hypothetical protein [Jeotgalicoccus meleagridis]CAD2075097.1 hypothetical protein JEODO184_00779 [Jeotgalicoccus meleagridis]HIW39105.1 hypothetical protein [Candidatus Jeotgalicoccus stercoravium]
MGSWLMLLVVLSFMFAILGFAAVLYYFLSQAFRGKDALVIDTPEEALERKI